jgi:SagB-type dehydrogenase family enzyme
MSSLPPRRLGNSRDHQQHYSATNMALTEDTSERFHGGGPSIALPPPLAVEGPPPWRQERSPGSLGLAELATLLGRVTGIHPQRSGRWRVAPTAGGLGSVELFVLSRGTDLLPAGAYHYLGTEHVLEVLGHVPPGDGRDTGLIVVGVGRLDKARRKYGSLGYRLVHLDAGVALSYRHDLAAALGLRSEERLTDLRRGLLSTLRLPDNGRYVLAFSLAVSATGSPTS